MGKNQCRLVSRDDIPGPAPGNVWLWPVAGITATRGLLRTLLPAPKSCGYDYLGPSSCLCTTCSRIKVLGGGIQMAEPSIQTGALDAREWDKKTTCFLSASVEEEWSLFLPETHRMKELPKTGSRLRCWVVWKWWIYYIFIFNNMMTEYLGNCIL